MQQLSRNLRQIEPIVQHGLQELQGGAPVDHTLREVALMASLVGGGVSMNEAIRTVERLESQLLSYGGYERAETMYHPGTYGKPTGVGKPAGVGKPVSYGMPTGVGKPVGYGMPTGVGKPVGMPVGVGKPVGYGMQPTSYGVPMGGVWMGR
jgi:hypothetical protein